MRASSRPHAERALTYEPSRRVDFEGTRALGEALAGDLQEFGCHSEVMLGRSKIEVTEVGCELRKQSLDVLAGTVPCDNTVHGRGVAKIMQARGA